MTGQPEGENFSRLCKRTFLERFCELVNHLPISTEVEAGAMKSLSYGELKDLAVYYQVCYLHIASIASLHLILRSRIITCYCLLLTHCSSISQSPSRDDTIHTRTQMPNLRRNTWPDESCPSVVLFKLPFVVLCALVCSVLVGERCCLL